ncbi:MAG: hypothetical protein JW776_04310 [Candidatus Lokiarchaeota archaeon]|nr:hypothetical protein [Candidatus Lokiarchaeota archaeon]
MAKIKLKLVLTFVWTITIIAVIAVVALDILVYNDVITVHNSLEIIRPFTFWRLDYQIYDMDFRAIWMIISAISSAIAGLTYFGVVIGLNKGRKKRTDKYMANMIFFTAVFLGITRLLESFYTVSESSLRGIIYVLGQFYIPFEALAYSMFIIFTIEVFLMDNIKRNEQFVVFLEIIMYLAFLFGVVGVFVEEYWSSDITFYVIGASYVFVVVILVLIIVDIVYIVKMMTKVQEYRKILGYILLQLILSTTILLLLIVALVFSMFSSDWTFLIRSIKHFLSFIHAVLYIPAFIIPRRKQL